MATLTIRDVPEPVVVRLKEEAARNGRSMEQEVRTLLEERFADRQEILNRIRARWSAGTAPAKEEVDTWIRSGRPHGD